MSTQELVDVAIVGAGPAGLSAAILLGRCRRRVVVIDSGAPRNQAAERVNGFLGLEAQSPMELREIGRRQASAFGVRFIEDEVVDATCLNDGECFELQLKDGETIYARKLLFATGVRDVLPEIEGIGQFYGATVHHCPYCDGLEHADKRLVAIGEGEKAVNLALSLKTWSAGVTACTMGSAISDKDRDRMEGAAIAHRPKIVRAMRGHGRRLERLEFASGPPLECDAAFFHGPQVQQSDLGRRIGCGDDQKGHVSTKGKQRTEVAGVFFAGDADGDVQFAIVAAAEGAIAATAVNTELQAEDLALLLKAQSED